MEFLKKIFISAAFVLFLVALFWLFTFEQPGAGNTSQNPQTSESEKIIQEDPVVTQQPETPTPTPETNPTNEPISGKLSTKSYTRDGYKGTYRGPFSSNNEPNGYGILKYDNGDMYIGEYKNGNRDGNGNAIFKRSNKINWRNFENGKRLTDETKTNWKLVKKTFTRDGSSGVYIGPSINGKPEGIGIFEYNNGDLYVGRYVNGTRHGIGSFCKSTGNCFAQKYVDGQLQ